MRELCGFAAFARKSGEGGIRTRDPPFRQVRDFQSRSLGQLGHLSEPGQASIGAVFPRLAFPLALAAALLTASSAAAAPLGPQHVEHAAAGGTEATFRYVKAG